MKGILPSMIKILAIIAKIIAGSRSPDNAEDKYLTNRPLIKIKSNTPQIAIDVNAISRMTYLKIIVTLRPLNFE